MSFENLQYTVDAEGNRTAVIIPIAEWKELQEILLAGEERQRMREIVGKGLRFFEEAKKGQADTMTTEELFNEL